VRWLDVDGVDDEGDVDENDGDDEGDDDEERSRRELLYSSSTTYQMCSFLLSA
jgi:hypothetical protein